MNIGKHLSVVCFEAVDTYVYFGAVVTFRNGHFAITLRDMGSMESEARASWAKIAAKVRLVSLY
jgi:hypothetical protein